MLKRLNLNKNNVVVAISLCSICSLVGRGGSHYRAFMVTHLGCKNALSPSNQAGKQQPLGSLLVLSHKPNFIMVNKLCTYKPHDQFELSRQWRCMDNTGLDKGGSTVCSFKKSVNAES